MFSQQSFIRRYADPARAQQTKAGKLFVFRGGWEWGVSGRRIVVLVSHPASPSVAESGIESLG
jgi:hypothetical protein